MCDFFSLVSDGKGKVFYFNSELRKKCLSKELNYNPDSHTSIADYFGYKGEEEDSLNKYEYNPVTREFVIDQINIEDDSKKAEEFCNSLDFKTIVPELIVKKIFHPFKNKNRKRVTEKDLKLLKEWAKIYNSIWNSIRKSIRKSIRNSIENSIKNSIGNSIEKSIRNSIRNSIRYSIGNSVWDSIGAYTTSFFNLKKWEGIEHEEGVNPFQACIDLWESGLVPSFDGETWRLHGGKDGKVLWEGKI